MRQPPAVFAISTHFQYSPISKIAPAIPPPKAGRLHAGLGSAAPNVITAQYKHTCVLWNQPSVFKATNIHLSLHQPASICHVSECETIKQIVGTMARLTIRQKALTPYAFPNTPNSLVFGMRTYSLERTDYSLSLAHKFL